MAFLTNSKVVKVIPPGGTAPSSGTRSGGTKRKVITALGWLTNKVGNVTRAEVPGATLDHQSGGSNLHPAGKAGSGASANTSGTHRV